MKNKKIKGYKGFNEDMTCRGMQYKEGETYIMEDNPKACRQGFHFCEYPLDCFNYYSPNKSKFYEVEALGDIDKDSDDTKVATNKLKVGAEVTIAGLVKASIEYTTERAKKVKGSTTIKKFGASSATGYYGASSATGYYGASSATGYKGASSATGNYGASSATRYYGASSATGYKGASSATGDYGASSATGDYGASSATGNKGASSATGDYGASSATGYYGASSATGNYGASSATGDYGASSATGNCGASLTTGRSGKSTTENKTAIAVAWGYEGRARGVIGSYIACAEWKWDEEDCEWKFVQAKMVQVDGEKIKENTFYQLVDGEFVEVEDD
jgi:hypothetical protein